MDNLNDILEEHISKRDRIIVAFGIHASNLEKSNTNAAEKFAGDKVSSDIEVWTVVSVYANGILGKSQAIETLKALEKDIDRRLPRDSKPERLVFCLEDDSDSVFRAKSHKVKGNLRANDDGLAQMGVVSIVGDGEKTRPATPEPRTNEVTKTVHELEL
ncbi:hypothetical protein M426DRAFT_90564 [Hypoxylon sp. CI-4A]|nr:hypothetical protein M426DRAFT_90564 [Hypoxylon sp. CI-4A]